MICKNLGGTPPLISLSGGGVMDCHPLKSPMPVNIVGKFFPWNHLRTLFPDISPMLSPKIGEFLESKFFKFSLKKNKKICCPQNKKKYNH